MLAAGELDREAGMVLRILSVAALAALCFAGPTGTITGTVTDPTGASVPKAHVTIRNLATNAVREAETDEDGDYSAALLPPGRYRVAVEKKGFRRSVLEAVTLDVDQIARVDFELKVGVLSEEVTVTDVPPLVQTDTSTLGQVVNGRQVRELPLNERNFLAFGLLVPGSQAAVEGSQNSTQGGAISVNGAREQSNNFLLEGVDNNDAYINQYVALPSIDAIQEFKVQSGNYSAEFGRSGGAQVNVILRSGSNQFHGSLFEFFRNRHMDAKNYFDLPGEIPRFDRNQFGATFGGPIAKDKTFFFTSYEHLQLRQASTRIATVPSQTMREAALALVPPSLINPAGLAVFNLYPAANYGPDLANSSLFVSAPAIRNTEHLGLLKLDHYFNPKDSISAHYSVFDENRYNPFDPLNSFTNLPGFGTYTLNNGQNAGLSWTRIITTSTVNEYRMGVNRMRGAVIQQDSGINYNEKLGFPTVLTNSVDLGYPNISQLGFDGFGEPINYPQDRHDTTVHLSDTLAWTAGRHQFKFGADIRKIQVNDYVDFLARGEWFFQAGGMGSPLFALAQLLVGIPDYAVTVKGDTYNSLRSTGMSYFVQDDIRVLPRLTLNAGLRYEYTTPPVETHDRFSVPDLSPASATCTPVPDCQFIRAGTNGIPRATYNATLTDFAPRIGLAWRPLKTERFVVRSAYGIFYDVPIMNINVFPRANPPFYGLFVYPNDSNGDYTIQNLLSQPGMPYPQPIVIARDFRDGYMQHWNADLQYELMPNWMIDLAYVGSKGTHLPAPLDMNQPRPDTGYVPYPQFSSILAVQSRFDSSYNGLQFRSEKRLNSGLGFLAAYTFSKSIDDMSSVFAGSVSTGLPEDSQNLHTQRGLSDFDARHRFVLSSVYDLPSAKRYRRLLGHWQASGILTLQSGSPFTVDLSSSLVENALSAFGITARPDLVGDPTKPGPVMANPDPACHTGAHPVGTTDSWFNTCAFVDPPQNRFGNAGRNIITGPPFDNVDFSLAKNIPLRAENRRLQFRSEFFNMLNHPNFDTPRRDFGSPNFGALLSQNAYGNKPPRQIQLGLKYTF